MNNHYFHLYDIIKFINNKKRGIVMGIFCKKCFGVFLVVFLAMGFCVPSFAAENKILYSSYFPDWTYAQLKDSKNWPDEQWYAFIEKTEEYTDNWTEEDWDFYYYEKEKEIVSLTGEQKAEQLALMEEIAQTYSEKRIEFYRKRMGAPDIKGVNVLWNGKFMKIEPNDLIVKDDWAYLSLSFFEKLGADVSFGEENEEITIRLKNVQATFRVGESTGIVRDEKGNTITIYLYDPLEKEQGTVYIPYDVLEEDFGYSINWDYELQILEIEDKKEIISQIDESFTAINTLLTKNQPAENDTVYESKGTISAILAFYGEDKMTQSSVDTNFQLTTQGESFWLKGNIKINADTLKLLFLKRGIPFPEEFGNIIPIELIYNAQEQLVYVKSEFIRQNAWLCMDKEYIEDSLFLQNITIGEIIFDSVGQYGYLHDTVEDNTNKYEKITQSIQSILGDENFTKNKKAGETTYTFYLNKENVKKIVDSIKFMAENDDYSSYSYDFIRGFFIKNADILLNADCELSFKEKDGVVNEIHMNIRSKSDDTVIPVKISIEYDADQKKETFLLECKGEYLGKMTVTMNMDKTTSNKNVQFVPPKNAEVIRY